MRLFIVLALALVACAPPAAPTCRNYSAGALFFCSEDISRTDDDAFVTTCEESGGTAGFDPCAPGTGTCLVSRADGTVRRFVAYTNGPEGPNLCEYLGGEWRPS